MRGEVDGEDDDGVGLRVYDNNKNEHRIAVDFDGEIFIHEQDSYPDNPSNRPIDESEQINQARRFARWHVYRERGYETLPRYENPDAIVGAMLAIGALSESAIDEQFGELLDGVKDHHEGNTLDVPFDLSDPGKTVLYRQDISVEPDPLDQDSPLAEQFSDYFSDPEQTLKNLLGDSPGERLKDILAGQAEPVKSLPEFEIETVSEIHYLYNDGGSKQTHNEPAESERTPDARIELLPFDPDVFDSRRQLLFSHLGNQVRDCFLLMGCEPPAVFQQQGLGSFEGMKKQQLLDMYEQYFLADDAAGSWQPGALP